MKKIFAVILFLFSILLCSFKTQVTESSIHIFFEEEYDYARLIYTCPTEKYDELETIEVVKEYLNDFIKEHNYYNYKQTKIQTKYKKDYIEYSAFVCFY